jgi:hypothetical protein
MNGDGTMPADITLREAQQRVDEWIRTVGVRYFSELTRLMARTYGDQSFKRSDLGRSLPDEMADVLWVLICLANQTGVDLTQALEDNFRKKNLRDADRHRENPRL